METQLRSFIKSAIWRAIGVFVLAAVTYFYTRHWVQTTWITILHHSVFLIIYFYHERFWIWVGDRIKGKKKYILRVVLYEIILGQGILGVITYIITGSLQVASAITITYIANKLWIYIVYDKIWERIKWQTN